MSKIVIVNSNEFTTPPAGKTEIYVKTTGDLAMRNDQGIETLVGTGLGGGGGDGEYEGGSSSTTYSVADIDIESGASA